MDHILYSASGGNICWTTFAEAIRWTTKLQLAWGLKVCLSVSLSACSVCITRAICFQHAMGHDDPSLSGRLAFPRQMQYKSVQALQNERARRAQRPVWAPCRAQRCYTGWIPVRRTKGSMHEHPFPLSSDHCTWTKFHAAYRASLKSPPPPAIPGPLCPPPDPHLVIVDEKLVGVLEIGLGVVTCIMEVYHCAWCFISLRVGLTFPNHIRARGSTLLQVLYCEFAAARQAFGRII